MKSLTEMFIEANEKKRRASAPNGRVLGGDGQTTSCSPEAALDWNQVKANAKKMRRESWKKEKRTVSYQN